jgi:hypothetical protein
MKSVLLGLFALTLALPSISEAGNYGHQVNRLSDYGTVTVSPYEVDRLKIVVNTNSGQNRNYVQRIVTPAYGYSYNKGYNHQKYHLQEHANALEPQQALPQQALPQQDLPEPQVRTETLPQTSRTVTTTTTTTTKTGERATLVSPNSLYDVDKQYRLYQVQPVYPAYSYQSYGYGQKYHGHYRHANETVTISSPFTLVTDRNGGLLSRLQNRREDFRDNQNDRERQRQRERDIQRQRERNRDIQRQLDREHDRQQAIARQKAAIRRQQQLNDHNRQQFNQRGRQNFNGHSQQFRDVQRFGSGY